MNTFFFLHSSGGWKLKKRALVDCLSLRITRECISLWWLRRLDSYNGTNPVDRDYTLMRSLKLLPLSSFHLCVWISA